MPMVNALLRLAEIGADLVCGIPRYSPGPGLVPRIVAHRGAWDSSDCLENTLPAFLKAREKGAWGIEFDVHFTKDLVPVIQHDEDLLRIFKHPGRIRQMTFQEVRAACPAVPRLSEVLALDGLHFMIEIKTMMSNEQARVFREALGPKSPRLDYHLLTIDPALVRVGEKMPANAWILVGELRLAPLVELSLARGYGGVAGHYLGMTKALIGRLHQNGQTAGVGFVPTKNQLNREWSRGADFVYTNSISRLF